VSFTFIEVTAFFQTPEGQPAQGTVAATLLHRLTNGDTQINPTPVLGELIEGHLKLQDGEPFIMPATDDTGTTPTGVGYLWSISLDNAPLESFEAPLPHAVNPVDLSTLGPSR
jgi:hypothetical protein